MRRLGAVLLAMCLGSAAGAECRQALALGLDISGSVDAREYRLQVSGLAEALSDPEVRDKLLVMPAAPVRLLVYEWSGAVNQHVVVPWTSVENAGVLDEVIGILRNTQRRDANPGTALGIAMKAGERFLAQQRDCWKRTLDISGDGKSNLGTRPEQIREEIKDSGITINGLVIGIDDPNIGDVRQADIAELSSYFNAHVILGPDAFVQTALGYEDFARAMRVKLIRELEGLVLSQR